MIHETNKSLKHNDSILFSKPDAIFFHCMTTLELVNLLLSLKLSSISTLRARKETSGIRPNSMAVVENSCGFQTCSFSCLEFQDERIMAEQVMKLAFIMK